jgi:hypothetical protein
VAWLVADGSEVGRKTVFSGDVLITSTVRRAFSRLSRPFFDVRLDKIIARVFQSI